MYRFLLLILIIPVCFGFDSKPKCYEKKVKGLYSVCIPLSLSEIKGLNPDASLQYMNPKDNIFIIVIDEPISELVKLEADYSLKNYLKFAIENMGELQNRVVGNTESIVINGVDALKTKITGGYDGTNYEFKLFVLKSKTHIFQILVWNGADLKEKKKKAVNDMVMSFRLL
jgi:hypothetical protein